MYYSKSRHVLLNISLFFIQQFNTDELTQGLPRLEDLGVEPTAVDTAAITVLRRHRHLWTFEEALDEEEICKPTSAYA